MDRLTKDLKTNIETIDQLLGVDESFDIGRRKLVILDKKIYLYYLSSLVDSYSMTMVITNLLSLNKLNKKEHDLTNFFDIIVNNISHESLEYQTEINNIYQDVLNGLLVIVLEGYETAISVELREYPTRGISEPDMEKVIRGPHDGFTESLAINIALLRRRIKDGRLRNKIYTIGDHTKTTCCLSYIEGVCDSKLIEEVDNRLLNVNTPHLIMTDKALEELILKQKFNPYPLVRYTERADTVAVHLYQGMFAIFVDTSPSVILAPVTFFDHLQHFEEYRQTPLSGTYLRFLRFGGIILSLFLTPLYLLFSMYPELMPSFLGFLFVNEKTFLPLFFQLVLAEIGVEFLRMASIHTPNVLSTAMGIIAGVLIGDIAIRVGFFNENVVLLIALAAIGTYITPSYELGLANKITKLIFLVMIYIFGLWGFIVAVLGWIIYLASLKSFNKPYLAPLLPFNFKRLVKVLIRFPYSNNKRGE